MSDNQDPIVPTPKAQETITLSKAQFEAIMQQVQALQNKVDFTVAQASEGSSVATAPTLKKNKNKTCRVWFIDTKKGKKVVMGYGPSRQKYNDQKEAYLEMTLIDNDKNTHLVDFKKFRDEAESVQVEILKQDIKEIEVNYGMVNKATYDYEKYKRDLTDEAVPLVSKVQKIILTVLMPDGTELVIPQEAVN